MQNFSYQEKGSSQNPTPNREMERIALANPLNSSIRCSVKARIIRSVSSFDVEFYTTPTSHTSTTASRAGIISVSDWSRT